MATSGFDFGKAAFGDGHFDARQERVRQNVGSRTLTNSDCEVDANDSF